MKHIVLRVVAAFAAVIILAPICLSSFAYAAETATGTVSISIESLTNAVLPTIATVVLAILGWVIARVPAAVQPLIKTFLTEQLLERAIAYGCNVVAGAARGKTVTVKVGNDVLAQALDYAVRMGSRQLITWLGGPVAVAERIWARLPLDSAATAPDFAAVAEAVANGAAPAPKD